MRSITIYLATDIYYHNKYLESLYPVPLTVKVLSQLSLDTGLVPCPHVVGERAPSDEALAADRARMPPVVRVQPQVLAHRLPRRVPPVAHVALEPLLAGVNQHMVR